MFLRNLPKKYTHIPYIFCCFLCLPRTPAGGARGEENKRRRSIRPGIEGTAKGIVEGSNFWWPPESSYGSKLFRC